MTMKSEGRGDWQHSEEKLSEIKVADAVGRLEDKKQNLLKVADQGRKERRIAASSN